MWDRILDDFIGQSIKWVEIVGDFNVRGNIKTVITASHQSKEVLLRLPHRAQNQPQGALTCRFSPDALTSRP